jgi:hypothetical protein
MWGIARRKWKKKLRIRNESGEDRQSSAYARVDGQTDGLIDGLTDYILPVVVVVVIVAFAHRLLLFFFRL